MGSNHKLRQSRLPRASAIGAAVAMLFPLTAGAAVYDVSSEAGLRAAITAANTNGDTNATIRLTASFTVTGGVLPTPSMPLTIDTQGFVLGKGAVSPTFPSNFPGGTITLNGTFAGTASAAPGNAMAFSGATGNPNTNIVVNNGTLHGGDQTGTGDGARGISGAGMTLINNGTIVGGRSIGSVGTTGSTQSAAVAIAGPNALVNNGIILGGDSMGGSPGAGVVYIAGTTNTVVNNGTIRGGSDLTGVTAGLAALRLRGNTTSITNSATGILEGGNGSAAVTATISTNRVTIVNAGVIKAGAGYANAIEFGTTATSTAALELQAGSQITGNVVANSLAANDVLKLGGTADATFDVSTIGDTAQYRFFDSLVKTGSSTWSLIGTGTTTMPWTIDQGTLQIGNGGTSGSIAGDVVNNGTLAFNRADAYTYGGLISGTGGVTQVGTGTTVLTAANTYTGPTQINAGTLAIDGSIASAVTVAAAGTLSGAGTVNGTVTNSGTVTPGNGSGVLTIAGNYVGNGGAIRVNAQLAGDASPAGRLMITGDTSGTSKVQVTNTGGLGASTTAGIKLIDVQGASNGDFTLVGDYTFQGKPAVVAGAYAYQLVKNGVNTPADGDWYLRSSLAQTQDAAGGAAAPVATTPIYAPTVPLYEAYAGVLQNLNELGTLQQRVGNRSWSNGETMTGFTTIGNGAWARVDGSHTHVGPSTSTTNASYNVRTWQFEAGVDVPVFANSSGTVIAAPTFHYGSANSNVSSMFGAGSIDATGYGFGGTLTWYGSNGAYVDAQAVVSWYDTDLRSGSLGRKLVDGNNGNGFAASIEAGHKRSLGGNWSFTPQLQLAWSQVRFDSFNDPYGAVVSRDNGNSLITRVGVSLDHEDKWTASNGKTRRSKIYGITNLYYDFLNGTSANVSGLGVTSKPQSLWAGLGIGASLNWDEDRYAIYGEALVRTTLQDFGDSNSIGAKFGFRYKW